MKTRKVRGHKRIQNDIKKWKESNLELDIENLERSKRDYCKVWVSPFADISISGLEIPASKGKNRKLILEGLLVIFNSWEQQLKTLDKSYYLAIWLFGPNIAKSQVICATDEMLDFYQTTFYRPEKQPKIPTQNYGEFAKDLKQFNWIFALDEHHFTDEDIAMTEDEYMAKEDYIASQKWYKRKLKDSPRSFTDDFNNTTYSVKKSVVWIGTK